MVQQWSGVVEGEIVGSAVQFDLALSNIDVNAMDGLTGPTEVSVEVSIE